MIRGRDKIKEGREEGRKDKEHKKRVRSMRDVYGNESGREKGEGLRWMEGRGIGG